MHRRPPGRPAVRREGDDAGRGLGRVADRRGCRRRQLAGGAREDRRHPVGGWAAHRARAARSRRTRAKDRGGRGVVRRDRAGRVPGGRTGRAADRVSQRGRAPLGRGGRYGRGAASARPARSPRREERRSPLHAFEESLPFLPEALPPAARPSRARRARRRASGTCSARSPGTPSGSDVRWRWRSRRTRRRPAPRSARRWRSISRRCGIARASSGATATPRTRSRRW